MTINFLNTYPPEATDKAWQKKKSFMDKRKAATKTGLGKDLLAAEAEWKLFVPLMDKLDIRSAVVSGRTIENVTEAKKEAVKIMNGQVKESSKALIKAAATAKKTSTNKDLSNTARQAALSIESKLMGLARNLRGINLDDFDNMVVTLQQQRKQAISLLGPYITSIRDDAKEVKKTPTVAKYDGGATAGFYQGIRGLNAAIAKSQIVPLMKWAQTNWRPMAQASFSPKQDNQVVAKVDAVLNKLDEFEKLLG